MVILIKDGQAQLYIDDKVDSKVLTSGMILAQNFMKTSIGVAITDRRILLYR